MKKSDQGSKQNSSLQTYSYKEFITTEIKRYKVKLNWTCLLSIHINILRIQIVPLKLQS